MARRDRVQEGGIILAHGWKLWPMDDRNWELCKAAEDGSWKPFGRYYSYNTVEEALLYVIDELWRSGCADEARRLSADLAGYRACVAEVREALAGVASDSMRAAGDRG